MSDPRRIAPAAALVLAIAIAAPRAHAGDAATAEALFKEGKALLDKKKYAEACPKLESSYAVEPALGTLINMADCHEKLGLVAKAWAEWSLAEGKAQRAGDAPRLDLAKRRGAALEPRLPKLRVEVRGGAPGLAVWRDDTQLDKGMFGAELPVDPGDHTVAVKRGDAVLKQISVTVQEKGREAVTIDLDAVAQANPAPPAPAATAGPAAPAVPDAKPSKVRGAFERLTFSLGGLGLFAGVSLEVVALVTKNANVGSTCAEVNPETTPRYVCTTKGRGSIDTARTLANVGQWAGIGGIALLGVGIALFVTEPPAPPKPAAARPWVTPWAGPGAGGLLVGGSF